ncbi:MAG TPA: MmgE/PrpD family protein [Pseudonocardia sp.]|jgi:2-methylcitrate dehydratase PrpD
MNAGETDLSALSSRSKGAGVGFGEAVVPVTGELARWICQFSGVSARAVREVKRAVLDLLGVMVAGSAEPAARLMLDYAHQQGGAVPGGAVVVGGGVRLAPSLAALVNGTAGHALDYDDIGLGAGHVSTAVVPAALAVAEATGASGAELISALAVGYEVTHRLTRVYGDNLAGPYAFGYHKPSVYSVFGATAAAARLLRLDPAEVGHALGIAASQAGGLRVNFGTMTKPMHAGNANRTGVEAALLARSGFTASPEALEGRYGWHQVLCRGGGELGRVLDAPDGPLAIEEGMIYKPFPCCGANHYAIDGVLTLLAREGLAHQDVRWLDVEIYPPYLDDVLIYPWPRTGLEGKFSLAYTVAAALVDGAVTPATFADEHLATLEPVRPKVRVRAGQGLPRDAVRIAVHTRHGRTVEYLHTALRGSLENPFSWSELAAKFLDNCAGTLTDRASEDVLHRIDALDEQSSVRPLVESLLGTSRLPESTSALTLTGFQRTVAT